MAITALQSGPAEVVENICHNNGSLVNSPSLGVYENNAFTAAQLNIAPAQMIDSGNVHHSNNVQ